MLSWDDTRLSVNGDVWDIVVQNTHHCPELYLRFEEGILGLCISWLWGWEPEEPISHGDAFFMSGRFFKRSVEMFFDQFRFDGSLGGASCSFIPADEGELISKVFDKISEFSQYEEWVK